MPTRHVTLTKELDRFVLTSIESGRYENESKVIRAALQTLERETQGTDSKAGRTFGQQSATATRAAWLNQAYSTVYAHISDLLKIGYYILSRAKNRHTLERMQFKQVVIASQKNACAAGNRQRKELVVSWIAAARNTWNIFDVHSNTTKEMKKLEAVGLNNVRRELWPGENSLQFLHHL